MWYSILRVGDGEIDRQHMNIDAYLRQIGDKYQDPTEIVVKTIDALISHFKSEEDHCENKNYNMSQDHKNEHLRLKEKLTEIKMHVATKQLDQFIAAYTIKGILYEHIHNSYQIL